MTEILYGETATDRANTLRKIAVDASGWETTYIDEVTGDIWILDYPEGEHHGGGLPRLTLATSQKAK